jgi:hypothetical protein
MANRITAVQRKVMMNHTNIDSSYYSVIFPV